MQLKQLMNFVKKPFLEKKEYGAITSTNIPSNFLWNGYNFNVSNYDFLYFRNFVLRSIVDKISNDVADICPLLPERHGFWDIINYPNLTQTWRELTKDHIARKLLDGTVYSYLTLNDDGTIDTIQAIPNKDVTITCENKYGMIDYFQMNFYQGYSIKINNYYKNKFDKRNTLYKWSDFNATSRFQCNKPQSRIMSVMDSLEYMELANRFNNTFFKNGAKPGYALVLTSENGYDLQLTEEQKEDLRASFYANYGGENVGKLLVLENGMKLEPLTTSIDKLNIVENMKEMIQIICMPFFIQPELLGISSGSTGAAYKVNEELRLYYYNSTIIPMVREWCEYCNRNFVFRYNPDTQRMKSKLGYDETKISVIMSERYKILESQFRCGIFTVNEIRDTIGWKSLEGMDEVIANTNWGNPNTANYKKNSAQLTDPQPTNVK